MKRLRTFAVSVWVLWMANSSSRGGEEEVARFRREYPAAARELTDYYARLKGTCTITTKRPNGSITINRCSFACDGGARKVEGRRYLNDDGPLIGEFVYCVGSGANFQLSRLPKKGYRIDGLGTNQNNLMEFNHVFGRHLSAPFLDFEYSLLKFMSLTNFRITSAQYVEHKGRTMMQVDCEVGDPATADKRKIVLDPDSNWVIHRAEVRPGMYPGAVDICEIEYASRESGPPLPKLVKFELDNATCVFESIRAEATPESEFRMSAYGLPDLRAAVPHKPRSYYSYWAGGIAVAGLLVASMFRILARRGRVVRA